MDGLLLINKEKNMTSHDVVNKVRKILNTKKVGHSGTLDPNVDGVLCIFVNKGTKAIQFMEDKTKQYHCVMKFGISTSTEDMDGEIIEKRIVELPLDKQKIEKIRQSFIGTTKQMPPMVSSVKINGKKLYEYAREGKEIERPLRDITITNFEILSIDNDEMEFVVDCSSGTYIRTLCVDFAKKYGTIGCMKSLTRTRVGKFTIDMCNTLEQLRNGDYQTYSILEALNGLEQIEYDNISDIYNGKKITLNCEGDLVLIKHNNEAIAVYRRLSNKIFGCERGLW